MSVGPGHSTARMMPAEVNNYWSRKESTVPVSMVPASRCLSMLWTRSFSLVRLPGHTKRTHLLPGKQRKKCFPISPVLPRDIGPSSRPQRAVMGSPTQTRLWRSLTPFLIATIKREMHQLLGASRASAENTVRQSRLIFKSTNGSIDGLRRRLISYHSFRAQVPASKEKGFSRPKRGIGT